jgi:hypothetical protein
MKKSVTTMNELILRTHPKSRVLLSYKQSAAKLYSKYQFGFLPLDMAAKYSINRLIDSRNRFEVIQETM